MSSTRPLRVLHVLHALGMGGAETWLMELLRLWAKEGVHRMDFLATGGQPHIFDEEALKLGARIHYLPFGRHNLGKFTREYRAILRRERYDAIHDHADYASGWHFALGAGVLPPVRVAHVHNPWLHIEANYATSAARRFTTGAGKALVQCFATHVCGTSAEILRRYGYEPGAASSPIVEVAHCGIDVRQATEEQGDERQSVREEFGWPQQTRIVLFAGRLDYACELDHPQNHKNSWLAANVARLAAGLDPNIRLIMAGAGEGRRELERRIAEWGLTDRLRAVGVRTDLSRLMHGSDVLLFPSRQEGLGMVAVEAQAAGLPVLASANVPREAIVIPSLFHALPLTAPLDEWARKLVTLAWQPRMEVQKRREAFMRSGFAIESSSAQLQRIYGGTN